VPFGYGRAVFKAAERCDMPNPTRAALQVLAAMCDSRGQVSLSHAGLARVVDTHDAAGKAALDQLLQLGWISIVAARHGRRPPTYALHVRREPGNLPETH
jgi:hypothetical protein